MSKVKKGVAIFFGLCFLGAIGNMFNESDSPEQESKQEDKQIEASVESESKEDTKTEEVKTEEKAAQKTVTTWKDKYGKSDIHYVGFKFLNKNADNYKGSVAMSVGKVYEVNDDNLQFETNKDNFFIEITCNFKDKDSISGIKEGDKVCVVGKVDGFHTYFGNKTTTVENCFIVANGSGVSKYEKKIKSNAGKEKKYIENIKKAKKEKEQKKAKKSKDSYISKCKSYSYRNIQRKPKKYKGKKIKVSGKVIQVSEGWFDSVTLRIEDSNGDIWLISHTYGDKEDKILEDDKVTVYGECNGTETYKAILGNSVTIPSVDAEYINIG